MADPARPIQELYTCEYIRITDNMAVKSCQRPPTPEQEFAIAALLAANGKLNESLAAFTTWLMVGVGATFSFVVANVEKITPIIRALDVREAMTFLLFALGIAVPTRLLSAVLTAMLDGSEKAMEKAEKLALAGKFADGIDLGLYFSECEAALFPPFKYGMFWGRNRITNGDWLAVSRFVAKANQIHAVLIFLQALLVIVAGLVFLRNLPV